VDSLHLRKLLKSRKMEAFMRIGFSLPLHGGAARPEGLITIAKRAEALG